MNLPESVCVQLWSLQGLSPERKAQYDAILATPIEHFNSNPAPIPNQPREKVEKITGEIEPWRSQLESIEWLKSTAAQLKRFCDAPLHIAKVRSILKDAKVIGNVPRHYAKRITRRIKKPLEIN